MSPNRAGLIQTGSIWSSPVLRDPPPLSRGRMGGPVAQLLKYTQRHMRETCSFSHYLSVTRGTGSRGACVVSSQ